MTTRILLKFEILTENETRVIPIFVDAYELLEIFESNYLRVKMYGNRPIISNSFIYKDVHKIFQRFVPGAFISSIEMDFDSVKKLSIIKVLNERPIKKVNNKNVYAVYEFLVDSLTQTYTQVEDITDLIETRVNRAYMGLITHKKNRDYLINHIDENFLIYQGHVFKNI